MPVTLVNWLTNQLIEHESDAEKWWKNPLGFHYLESNSPDDDPFLYAPTAPPAGWQRLPFHHEEPLDGE